MNPKLKPYFRQINLLFYSLAAGIVVTFGAMFIISPLLVEKFGHLNLSWLVYAGPFSGLAFIILSNRLYRSRILPLRESTDLALKLNEYRSSVVLRMIVLDVAAILNVFCFGFTRNWLFAALSGVVLMLFALYRPGPKQLVRDLQLEGADETFILVGDEK